MKNLHTVLERTTLLFSSYKSQIKSKTDELELAKEKREHILYRLFGPKEIF